MTRTRAILLYGGIAIVVAATASIASMPASIAAGIVSHATEGRVTFSHPTGTLWNGRADVNLATMAGPIALRDVQWSVRAWRLALAEFAADVRIGGPEPRGKGLVAFGFGTLHVRDAELSVPARFVADRVQWLRPWETGGVIDVKGDDVEILQNGIVGDAQVLWRNASAAKLARLGDYQLTITGDRQTTRMQLATLSGSLQLAGSATLTPTGAFRMQGSARAEPSSRERLAPLLVLLGPQQPDGSVAFEWPLGGGGTPAGGPGQPRKGASIEASVVGMQSARSSRSLLTHSHVEARHG